MDDKDYVFVPVVISETGATFLFQQEIKRGEKLTDEQVQAAIRKAADEFLRYTDAGKVLQHNFKNRLTYLPGGLVLYACGMAQKIWPAAHTAKHIQQCGVAVKSQRLSQRRQPIC